MWALMHLGKKIERIPAILNTFHRLSELETQQKKKKTIMNR